VPGQGHQLGHGGEGELGLEGWPRRGEASGGGRQAQGQRGAIAHEDVPVAGGRRTAPVKAEAAAEEGVAGVGHLDLSVLRRDVIRLAWVLEEGSQVCDRSTRSIMAS
jgi:hypothetical protein